MHHLYDEIGEKWMQHAQKEISMLQWYKTTISIYYKKLRIEKSISILLNQHKDKLFYHQIWEGELIDAEPLNIYTIEQMDLIFV